MEFDSHWLWHDVDVLFDRQRKATAVIAAVARVAEAELPRDEQAQYFVRSFGRYGEFSRETRDLLAAEPYTYYWGRLAYELLQLTLQPDLEPFGLAAYSCRSTGLAPRAALSRHFAQFPRLLVAAACLDGVDLDLERPLSVAAPFALPGTALGFDGSGDLEIIGIRDGTPAISSRSSGPGDAHPVSYPTADSNGCRLRLQPPVFNVPASGIPEDLARLDLQLQTDNRSRVENAVTLLHDVNPDVVAQFRAGLRVVAARPKGAPGALSNVSHCDLPGAIAIYAYPNPHELCNLLVHEFLHNRLFALEERGHFLEADAPGETAATGIYSPWRRDYRPAHGLLHAVYVFTGVGRYWLDVVHNDNTPEQIRELAVTRIMHSLLQVRIGLAQLRRRARFTESGGSLVDLIDQEHQALWRDANGAGISADMTMRVFDESDAMAVASVDQTPRSLVRHHLHRYAQADHARELEGLIAASALRA